MSDADTRVSHGTSRYRSVFVSRGIPVLMRRRNYPLLHLQATWLMAEILIYAVNGCTAGSNDDKLLKDIPIVHT